VKVDLEEVGENEGGDCLNEAKDDTDLLNDDDSAGGVEGKSKLLFLLFDNEEFVRRRR
jgi:hypothetical protein